jgi:uncharacterized protein YheU (UPF0270 family)
MKDADEHTPPPVEVAPDQLSPQALRGVVEAFVLREGTNYDLREVDFETKVAQVLRQLESGDAQILFDPATESVTIAPTVRPRGTARWRKNPP